MKELSKEQIKERAKHLRQVLLEKHKIDLPHGHALEVLAKVFGFKNWNTASALTTEMRFEPPVADKPVADVSKEKPEAAKFLTAGELIKFLSKFDEGTKLFVNEYNGATADSNDQSMMAEVMAGTKTAECMLTYDPEIQNGNEIRFELNEEKVRFYQLNDFGKSANQFFDQTESGRSQRRNKSLYMQNSFWSPKHIQDLSKNNNN